MVTGDAPSAGVCAQCGAPLEAKPAQGPRLVLLCPRCRSSERPTEAQLVAALPQQQKAEAAKKRRWTPRKLLRAFLILIAFGLALLRLWEMKQ